MMKSCRLTRPALMGLSLCLAISLSFFLVGCAGSNGAQTTSTSASQPVKPLDLSATIEPTTLLDDSSITVVAEALTFKNDNVYIDLALTNKTGGKLSVSCGTMGYDCNYINDYMVDGGYLNVDIEPGETVREDTYFNGAVLALFGISEIREIGLGVSVRNSDYKTVFQGPTNVKTSLYDTATEGTGDYQAVMKESSLPKLLNANLKKFSTDEVFSQNGIRIVSEALATNTDGNSSLLLQVVNDSDSLVNTRYTNIAVNGQTAYEGYWTGATIAAGKQAVVILNFDTMIDDEERSQFDLDNIRTVSFAFEGSDASGNTIIPSTEVTVNI